VPTQHVPEEIVQAIVRESESGNANTDKHDITKLDGYEVGLRAGVLQGRADVRSEDRQEGVEAAMRALHVYLLENDFTNAQREQIVEDVRARVRFD
jgi:hypothetical protein